MISLVLLMSSGGRVSSPTKLYEKSLGILKEFYSDAIQDPNQQTVSDCNKGKKKFKVKKTNLMKHNWWANCSEVISTEGSPTSQIQSPGVESEMSIPQHKIVKSTTTTKPHFIPPLLKKENCSNSFDRFGSSLESIISEIQLSVLADKWETLTEWIDKYHINHYTQEVLANIRTLSKSVTTYSSTTPTVIGTSRTCLTLHQMLLLLQKSHPSLSNEIKQTHSDIMKSVFVNWAGEDNICNRDEWDSLILLPTATNIEKLLDSFRKKTYFTLLTEELHSRQKNLSDIQLAEMKRVKGIKAVDRCVRFWQQQLVKRLLFAWKLVVKDRKKEDELGLTRQRASKLQGNIGELESAIADNEKRHKDEVIYLKRKIQKLEQELYQSEEDNKLLSMAIREQKTISKQTHSREVSLLQHKASVDAVLSEVDSFLDSDLFGIIPCKISQSKWNRYDAFKTLSDTGGVTSSILRFFNIAISRIRERQEQADVSEKTTRLDLAHSPLTDLRNIPKLLDAYIAAYHYVNSNLVSVQELQEVINEPLANRKAELFLRYSNRFGMSFPCSSRELVSSAKLHQSIMCSIIQYLASPFSSLLNLADTCKLVDSNSASTCPLVNSYRQRLIKCSREVREADRALRTFAMQQVKIAGSSDQQNFKKQGPAFVYPTDVELVSFGVQLGEDKNKAIKLMEDNWQVLTRVFFYYRNENHEIGSEELKLLLRDSRISKVMGKASARSLISLVKENLTVHTFSIFILKIATSEYRTAAGMTTEPTSSVVEKIIKDHISVYCTWYDVEPFRAAVGTPQVYDVMNSEFSGTLKSAFKSFASRTKGIHTMNREGWLQFISSYELLDENSNLTGVAVDLIPILAGDPNTGILSFQQFQEAICCLAAYRTPCPYQPLQCSVRAFIETKIKQKPVTAS